MIIFKIILSCILALIVLFSYLSISDINNSEMIKAKKRKWVLFVLYFPIIGAFCYFYKKRKNELNL